MRGAARVGLLAASALALLPLLPRPRPAAVERALFEGVSYAREVLDRPRPAIVHLVRIDLAAPGISFQVTAADSQGRYPARTTGAFLEETGVAVAINGGFFEPFHSDGPWDYHPRAGERVDASGFTASGGVSSGRAGPTDATVSLGPGARVRIGGPVGDDLEHAITGNLRLDLGLREAGGEVMPRTAIGLDREGGVLFLVVVDGRQGSYSQGLTLAELGRLLQSRGVDRAVQLDGGGSSTLVARDGSGGAEVLNSPIHTRVPGRQRPVATHVGVRASAITPGR